MKGILLFITSFSSGIVNGLFGAGGGILAVRHFRMKGLAQKKSQATALLLTFLMSVISCAFYLIKSYFSFFEALPYLPFGVVGAVAGCTLLKKFPDKFLKKLFSLFIIWAGARMIFR